MPCRAVPCPDPNPVIFRTIGVVFSTDRVIFLTNSVIYVCAGEKQAVGHEEGGWETWCFFVDVKRFSFIQEMFSKHLIMHCIPHGERHSHLAL